MTDAAVIDAEYSIVPAEQQDDAEYAALLAKLDRECPTVTSKGFDFQQIRGTLDRVTAKAIILHLSLSGMSVSEIAERLEVSCSTARRFLADAIREAAPIDDVSLVRKHELMKLDQIERACDRAFERSCEDSVTITTEKSFVDGEDGEQVEETTVKTVRHGQSGNAAFLKTRIDCIKERDRLLGLAEPVEVNVNREDRRIVVVKIEEVSSRDQLSAAPAIAGMLKQN